MNVLIVEYNYANTLRTRVCEVRETKTMFIEEDSEDGSIKYKKCGGRVYAATNGSTWFTTYLYHLDSDFAIDNLGDEVLSYDHPNKDYIRKRFNELTVIDNAKEKLNELLKDMTYEKAVQLLEILK